MTRAAVRATLRFADSRSSPRNDARAENADRDEIAGNDRAYCRHEFARRLVSVERDATARYEERHSHCDREAGDGKRAHEDAANRHRQSARGEAEIQPHAALSPEPHHEVSFPD